MSCEVKQMLKEIFLAMGAITLLVLFLIGICYQGPFSWPVGKYKIILGILFSFACCVFMMIHMALSYSAAVELVDPSSAQKKMARSTVVRFGVVLLVAFLCYLTGWVDMIAFAFGLLVLKPALYLQTFVHRRLCGPEPEATMPPEGAYDDIDDDRLPGESHHLGPQVNDTINKINQITAEASRKEKPCREDEVSDNDVSNRKSGC